MAETPPAAWAVIHGELFLKLRLFLGGTIDLM
jgi:hypothetical protein